MGPVIYFLPVFCSSNTAVPYAPEVKDGIRL